MYLHYHLEVQANQNKIEKKNATFSIYGRKVINPSHFKKNSHFGGLKIVEV